MRIQSNGSDHDTFQAAQAILLYKNVERRTYQTDEQTGFATLHEVTHADSGVPELQAGTLLTNEGLLNALQNLNQNTLAFLPPHVLGHSSTDLIWFSPSQRRRLFFETSDEYLNTQVNGLEVPMPAMLWQVTPRGLHVYALDSDERPTPTSVLHHAPVLNTYHTGNVCLGSTVLPRTLSPGATQEYETGFFNSAFTHANTPHLIRNYSGTLGQLLYSLKDATEFPVKHLIPMNTTVGELFK